MELAILVLGLPLGALNPGNMAGGTDFVEAIWWHTAVAVTDALVQLFLESNFHKVPLDKAICII